MASLRPTIAFTQLRHHTGTGLQHAQPTKEPVKQSAFPGIDATLRNEPIEVQPNLMHEEEHSSSIPLNIQRTTFGSTMDKERKMRLESKSIKVIFINSCIFLNLYKLLSLKQIILKMKPFLAVLERIECF